MSIYKLGHFILLLTGFYFRAFDILMLAKARGREREEREWLKILKEADQRFDIVSRRRFNTKGDFGPFTGIIEVVFNA